MHNLQQFPEEKLQLFEIKTLLLANLWRLFFQFWVFFSVMDLPVYCLYREISS